jgi:hypothetical protein
MRSIMPHTPWQSQENTATVHLNDFQATANLARLHDGLAKVIIAGQPFPAARLLGIVASLTAAADDAAPMEHYVRGADLIIAYEKPGPCPIRVDCSWRATAPVATEPFLAAVDLVVSVRAYALDGHPEMAVSSTVPANEVLRLQTLGSDSWAPLCLTIATPTTIGPDRGTGCLLFRMPGLDLSYVEMAHPADFQYDELQRDASQSNVACIAHRLFRTNLEKGVILRAQVRGIFLKRTDDMESAARCYAAFAGVDPPLGA